MNSSVPKAQKNLRALCAFAVQKQVTDDDGE
jgi:hypothetical protein